MGKATKASVARRRHPRDSTVGGSDSGKKIKAIEEMGIGELPEEAVLASASQKLFPESKVKGDEKVVSGTAELDEYLPDDIKSQYHVLEQDGEFYDAMLNQTNVGDNNNKFYTIQVLEESRNGGKFMVYSRWGRVGMKAKTNFKFLIAQKRVLFKSSPKSFWQRPRTIGPNVNSLSLIRSPIPGWKWITAGPKTPNQYVFPAITTFPRPRILFYIWLFAGSTLALFYYGRSTKADETHPQIAKFISLICDTQMMEKQMVALGYNAKKLPLDKLSKSTIFKGYNVLRRIADAIGQSDKKMLEQLTGEFYTIIPHDFGFKRMCDCIIDNPYELRSTLEMVEALGEIEIAASLFKDGLYGKVAPGEIYDNIYWNSITNKFPYGKLSYVGRMAPDPLEAQVLEDGVVVPLGKPQQQPPPTLSLGYNEYLIYNINQTQIHYIVQGKFCYT